MAGLFDDDGGGADYKQLLALQLMRPMPPARSFGEGLLNGLRGAAGAGMMTYYGQQDEEKHKKLADAIAASGGDIEALKTTAPEAYGKIKLQQAIKGEGGPSFGTSPTWGVRPETGKPAPFIVDKSGATKWLEAGKPPPDITASPGIHSFDAGDKRVTVLYDPRTGERREIASAPRDLSPPMTDVYDPATGEIRRGRDVEGATRPPRVGEGVDIQFDDQGRPLSIATGTKTGGAKAFDQTYARKAAEGLVEDQKAVNDRYDAALTTSETMDEMMTVLEGVQTGKLTTLSNNAKAYLAGMGVPFDEKQIGNIQYAEKMANDFALNALQKMGGNDATVEYLKQIEYAPGPNNTRRRLEIGQKAIELQVMQLSGEAEYMADLSWKVQTGEIGPQKAQLWMREFRRAAGKEKIKAFREWAKQGRAE